MPFAWRSRYGGPAVNTGTTLGLRWYRRLADSLRWLFGTRDTVMLDMQANPATGGTTDFAATASQNTNVPWNHVRWDPWLYTGATTPTTNISLKLDPTNRNHPRGWWCFTFSAKFLAVDARKRALVEIRLKMDNGVEHIISRFDHFWVDAGGGAATSDVRLMTGFIFNFARFDRKAVVEIVCNVWTDASQNTTINTARLSGSILMLSGGDQGLAPGGTAWLTPTRWSGTSINSGHVSQLVNAVRHLAADLKACDLEMSTSLFVAPATETGMAWDTEMYDPWAMHAANSQRITVDTQSIVAIWATVPINETEFHEQNFEYRLSINRNGLPLVREGLILGNWGAGGVLWVGTICKANVGDFFEALVYHTWKDGFGTQINAIVGSQFIGYPAVARFSLMTLSPQVFSSALAWTDPPELAVNAPFAAADFNVLVDDATLLGAQRPGARVWLNGQVNVPNNTWTGVPFNNADFNFGPIWPGGLSSLLTVPAGFGGVWLVAGNLMFNTTFGVNATLGLAIYVNGATEVEKFYPSRGTSWLSIPPTPVKVNAGDSIGLVAYQNTGALIAVGNAAGDTTGYCASLSAYPLSKGS